MRSETTAPPRDGDDSEAQPSHDGVRGGVSASQRRIPFVILLATLVLPVMLPVMLNASRAPSAVTMSAAPLAPSHVQGANLDYANFSHRSARHASLACASCHSRPANNSATPVFPGHKACTDCHLAQFVTPQIAMCNICHASVDARPAPLKNFPARFDESFNVRFDHAQHMTGAARPERGCTACHTPARRGVALSIPAGLPAHNQCYSCHTPDRRDAQGRDLASCNVCHAPAPYRRTPTDARAFRASFSHAAHGTRQRLACADCHTLAAGLPQTRQVSAPRTAQHFPSGRAMSCLSCHNGRRAFGDADFQDCRRCHRGQTFRMPL